MPILKWFPDVVILMNKVWVLMTSNFYFVLLVAAGLVSVGVCVFRAIKRAARK